MATLHEWRLGFSKTVRKLYWFNIKTKFECDYGETPDGVSISNVGDWCRMWSRTNKSHFWYNFRTHEKSDTEECPKVTLGEFEKQDGVLVSVNPYGLRRQHPDFDERATRHWRQWNQCRTEDDGDCTEEIDNGPVTKKQKKQEDSSNAMAVGTQEKQQMANRDRVRKCRAKMNDVQIAVAKLENTLRKRLFRQKEKRPRVTYRCELRLPPTDKQMEQTDQTKETKRAKAAEKMRIYRSNLSAEKKDETKKQNTKRKAELRQLERDRETSLERIQRLEQQAYTTRKSLCKTKYGDKKYGDAFLQRATTDYYIYKHG